MENQHALKERVKELECLYEISALISKSETLDEVAQFICTRAEKAFQYPELASVSLSIGDKQYGASPQPSLTELKHEIIFQNEIIGHIRVCYLVNNRGERLTFLEEEEKLLNKIALEITHLYERQESRKTEIRLNEIVQRQDRLTVLGEMTAGIAHELNTPLGNVIGFSEFILSKTDEPQIKRDAEKIIQSAFHAREIVKKLMLFSCEIPHKLSNCSVQEVIAESIALLEPYLKQKKVEISLVNTDGKIKAWIDKIQFTQVFFNLLKNAVQASKAGDNVNVSILEKDNYANVIIEDFGVGIPSSIQNKIFDPFFTHRKGQQGNGLGLSVVHGIIKQHKGRIQFSSEVNKGTTFVISIPKAS